MIDAGDDHRAPFPRCEVFGVSLREADAASTVKNFIDCPETRVGFMSQRIHWTGSGSSARRPDELFQLAQAGLLRWIDWLGDAVDLHIHLHRQGPAGDVIGPDWRTIRRLTQFGILLHLK